MKYQQGRLLNVHFCLIFKQGGYASGERGNRSSIRLSRCALAGGEVNVNEETVCSMEY